MLCEVPSEKGTLTIPSALLSNFEPGTVLVPFTVGIDVVRAGDYEVKLRLAGVVASQDRMRRVSVQLE